MSALRPTLRWLVLVLVTCLVAAAVPRAQQGAGDSLFERGADAYRRGAWADATALWEQALADDLVPESRARVAYDLGNAAWRRGDTMRAVAWYTTAVRLDPRNADAWHNLELARAQAELDPADRGDLRSTVERLLAAPRPSERRWAVLIALVLLAVPLTGEALRGGRLWSRLSLVAGLVLALATALWIHGWVARGPADPVMVVQTPSVGLRAEPRPQLQPTSEVRAGEELERIDQLPGWVRLGTPDGRRGWVRESAIAPLDP